MKEGFVMKAAAEPVAGEMEAINRYTRRAYKPEEVYAFSLVLCDNQVDRDYERFAVDSLKKLKELFLGKTCILDHERKSANQTARIFSTALEEVPGEVTQAGEKLVRLTARAYLPRTQGNQETIELIESGILKEVSVSCSVKRSVCGICGKETCEHVKGKTYQGKIGHSVLMEPTDAYECSFVAVPAQRGAGVVKRFGVEEAGENPEPQEQLLTKAQLDELTEKARWGEQYRRQLEKDVLKFSAIVQPDMPRTVMEAAVKGLDIGSLSEMARTYGQMAQRTLPLKPQLAPRKSAGSESGNRAFKI